MYRIREITFALKILLSLLAIGAAALFFVIYLGAYDITATDQHTRPVHWALDKGMRQAVRLRARHIKPPSLDDPTLTLRGFIHYRDSCQPCHGAPGVAPAPFAQGMMPLPNNLAQTAIEWSSAELYWVTRNGIKMTGMPAWEFRYPDAELWQIVAFVKRLPTFTAADYAELDRKNEQRSVPNWHTVAHQSGDARRGMVAIQQYACTACHTIPGIVGAEAHVGPSLLGIGSRRYLAGRLPNTTENMIRWLRQPHEVKPGTLMPDLQVADHHARDIAAYLATLN